MQAYFMILAAAELALRFLTGRAQTSSQPFNEKQERVPESMKTALLRLQDSQKYFLFFCLI